MYIYIYIYIYYTYKYIIHISICKYIYIYIIYIYICTYLYIYIYIYVYMLMNSQSVKQFLSTDWLHISAYIFQIFRLSFQERFDCWLLLPRKCSFEIPKYPLPKPEQQAMMSSWRDHTLKHCFLAWKNGINAEIAWNSKFRYDKVEFY